MPWYFPWPDYIKKKACRYLLQHYVGSFLEEKLTLDQLSVDLYSGTGTVKDVKLDVWALNELLESVSAPIEMRDGTVGSISVEIPWSALLTANSKVEIRGLKLTFQPKYRVATDVNGSTSSSMMDSMWSGISMTNSMQLAQECLKRDSSDPAIDAAASTGSQPFEGPELLAQMIESVLTRVEMSLIDTVIRLEHVPHNSQSGIALELHIERLRYFDEGAHSSSLDHGSSVDTSRAPRFEPPAIAHKNFQMMGVTLHCEEFPEDQRHGGRAPSFGSYTRDLDRTRDAFPLLAHSPEMPPEHNRIDRGGVEDGDGGRQGGRGSWELLERCIVGECAGKQEVKVKVKQQEHIGGPKAEVETYLGSINLFLAPRQVHLLLELFSGFLSPATSDVTNTRDGQPNKPMQPEDYQRIEGELQEHLNQDKQQQHEERLRRESWGLKEQEEQGYGDVFAMQSMEDDDLFFSMTGSLMSISHTGTMDDMEASFTSTVSSSSTDTTKTGSSLSRLGYGSTVYRGPSLTSFGTAVPKTTQPRRSRSKKGLREQLEDPTAELTRYKLRLSSLSLTVLHTDPSSHPTHNSSPTGHPQTAMHGQKVNGSGSNVHQIRAGWFFDVLGKQGFGKKDQREWKERFARACPYDHLRLTAAPVTIDCDRKTAPNVTAVTAELSFGMLELYECLFDRPRGSSSSSFSNIGSIEDPPPCQHIEILSFKKEDGINSEYVEEKPSLGVRLKSLQRMSSQGSQHRIIHKPRSEVTIDLGHLTCEVDMTTVDRLYALLHPQPMGQSNTAMGNGVYRSLYAGGVNLNKQALFNQALDDTTSGGLDQHLDICISCPVAHIAFRFPIPDLRELSDTAWWKRSLRDEILHLELLETEFRTVLGDGKPYQTLLFQCRELHSSLQLGPDETPTSFLCVSHSNLDLSVAERDFDWPKLVLKLYPRSETSVFEDAADSDTSPPVNSWEGACHFKKPEVSPFSSKRVMYDSEQMVMPGDQEEMREFSEKAINSSRVVIDLLVPSINVLLPSKDFVELLYNRFGYDVLLWQPAAPTPRDCHEGYTSLGLPRLDLADHLASAGMHERFTMCQSGMYFDSDSDTEEDCSTLYPSMRKRSSQQSQAGNMQSFLSLNLTINHGKLTLCTPLKDSSCHGETMLELEDGWLFAVTDYKGNTNLSYLCLQANRLALYHNGQVEQPLPCGPLPQASWSSPDHLQCCVYLSDHGVPTKLNRNVGNGQGSQNMLAVALKMYFNPETNIKNMECAVGIRGATLRHYMTKPEHSWLVQLSNFFDVVDEEVLGYSMPAVVTEFHAHFWGCGIDYRPLYLPLRTYLLAETLSISSNLVYEAKESLLRFLVDDAAIYLSDQCNERSVDIRNNYVCILDLGMLEISLRMSAEKDKNPKVDLKVSNNIVHLRTCADSCTALARLMLYLANDGDQTPQQSPSETSEEHWHQQQQKQQMDDEEQFEMNGLPVLDSPIGGGSHLDQMQQLMDEAMRDVRSGMSPPADQDAPINIPCTMKTDGDLFLFPNEDLPDISDVEDHHSLNGSSEPVSILYVGEEDIDGTDGLYNDDEFCVLDDPGMGVLRKRGEPEVKCLDDTPVVIKEDHFTRPLGRGDQLNGPADFPTPVTKYTLQEMTVVWHIYGGNDFGPVSTRKHSLSDVGSSSPVRPGTPDRKGGVQANVSSPGSRKSTKEHQMSWQERGGPGRDHSTLMELQLNKVRFQHAEYPDSAQQRSRQILLISDIEIRDRLANSQINKFLYLYSSETRPRRNHANMVLVKALHIRPDPDLSAEECCLRVSLQPLRLNIDQDSLFFLHDFFSKVSSEAGKVLLPETKEHLHHYATSPTTASSPSKPQQSTPPASIEQMLADGMEEGEGHVSGRGINGDSVGVSETHAPPCLVAAESNPKGASTPIFFRSFVFSPDVPIKLDYEGKRVDMEQGTLMGLLIGLGQLNHSELTLKRLHNRHGLLGVDKLVLYVVNEWAMDIRKTQLPSLLGGVGPMHSLVQLVQGIVDLVRLPVEQYRKDGRLMRGFQRGASSFGTSTAMAAVELTNRMVRLLQTAAETAYDMVSPGPSVSTRAITYGPFGQSRLARQPADFREGMANAFNVVREGLEDAAIAIVQVAREEHEHKGVSGAVGGILRQIPPTVIKPLILASEATSSVLGGMRNQMLPDARREDAEKWRTENDK